MYSEGTLLEERSVRRLFCLRAFVIFLSLSKRILEE
jgi:hypothetical protein